MCGQIQSFPAPYQLYDALQRQTQEGMFCSDVIECHLC